MFFKSVLNASTIAIEAITNPGTAVECPSRHGTIIENFGNTNFKVQLDINEDMHVTGTISGKMRMHYIKVGVGDRVHVEMSPYDLTKCRITKRLQ